VSSVDGTTSGCAVVVLARAPRPGLAKTRLQPLLGVAGAAALQAVLVEHTAALACSVAPSFLAYDPPDAGPELRALVPPGVALFPQVPGDLGTRMAAAVAHVAAATGQPVVVIGSDVPTLGPDRIRQAARLLAEGADAVLGPAVDGGYYLIGLPAPDRAAFAIDPSLWGGPHVLAATREALVRAGREPVLLDPLSDLDTPDDARALLAAGGLPDRIAAVLRLPPA
jgi:rSAM/selenodomain-associated transferase 1